MSFIGSGELEHKITQLQRQLDHKDHELNSLKNEQRKRDEELVAAKRAKEAAEQKLRDEADRAHQAETATSSKSTEISQLRLKLSNLESTLTQTADKLKKEEKEKDRIQDSLDAALSSSSDGSARQIRDQQARVKQLEEQLKRAEEEREKMRSSGSTADAWGSNEPLSRGERNKLMAMQNEVQSLRDENTKLKAGSSSKPSTSSSIFGDAAPTPAKTRGKRRSLSVSAASEVRELEVQIDSLKEQLVNLKRDLDKAVNEKLAVEIAGKKKYERLEGELDEMRSELDYYKTSSGSDGVDKKELEKVRKAAEAEKELLAEKLRGAEVDVKKKEKDIVALEGQVQQMEVLQSELDNEKLLRQELQQTISSTSASLDDSALTAKITALETELAKARSAPSSSSTTAGAKASDGDLRQVRRELQKALRDKEYLDSLVKENDELLAEKDEEIQRLRTAIPIPGSPTLGSSTDPRLVAQLEEEKAEIRERAEKYRIELEGVEKELSEAKVQLAEASVAAREVRSELSTQRAEVETLTTRNSTLTVDLQAALNNLTTKDEELERLSSHLAQVQLDLGNAEASALSARAEMLCVNEKLDAAGASLADKTQILEDVLARRDQLEQTLASRSHDDVEFDALSVSARQEAQRAIDAEHKVQELVAQIDELVGSAQEEREAAASQLESVRAELKDAHEKMIKAQKAVKTASDEKDTAINAMSEQLVDLQADLSSLQIQLDDKIAELSATSAATEEVQNRFEQAVKDSSDLQTRLIELEEAQADRSTASEAREKDERLFALQEEKRKLEETLSAAKEEYAREISSTSFKAEQDLHEAHSTIAQLKSSVKELQSTLVSSKRPYGLGGNTGATAAEVNQQEVRRLEDKIGRLRIERDELRHNVSFVSHERFFAVRAALSDREAAMTDVKKAQAELVIKGAAYDKLSGEVEALRRTLEQASGDGQSREEEEKRLNEKVVELEANLQIAKSDVDTHLTKVSALENDLQAAEKRCSALQAEMSNLIHHVGSTAHLSDPPLSATSGKEGEDNEDDLPADLPVAPPTGRPSHTRSRSSISSSMLHHVTMERNLQAKIQRREERITTLTNELNKAKANLALAQDAQEEVLAENAELVQERDSLQAQVSSSDSDPDINSMREFVLALAVHRQATTAASARLRRATMVRQTHEQAIKDLTYRLTTTSEQGAFDRGHIDQLTEEKTQLNEQVDMARKEEARARFELQQATGTIVDLQTRLAAAEAAQLDRVDATGELVAAQTLAEDKDEQIRVLQLQISDLSAQLEQMQQDVRALTSDKKRAISDLSTTIEELEDQRALAQAARKEKEAVMEEIEAAEKALAEGMADAASARAQLEERLQATGDQLAQLKLEVEEKSKRVEEMDRELEAEKKRVAEIQGASEQVTRLENEADELRLIAKRMEEEKEVLKKEVAELGSRAEGEEGRLTQLSGELEEKEAELGLALSQAGEKESKVEALEQSLKEKAEIVVGVKRELESLQTKLEGMEKGGAAQQAELERLTAALADTNLRLEALQKELEENKQAAQEKEVEAHRLGEINQQLKDELAELLSKPFGLPVAASAAASGSATVTEEEVIDLKERIEQLEASLTQKNAEVDEADDSTKEAYKTVAKLNKKIGKLQRQVEGLTVDLNTARNKVATLPTLPTAAPLTSATTPTVSSVGTVRSMPPPSLPGTSAVPTTVQRTPLSSINIFDPSPKLSQPHSAPSPSGSSLKRHRGDSDEPPVPAGAEAIMLPPTLSSLSSHSASPRHAHAHAPSPRLHSAGTGIGTRRPLGAKTSFTPQRNQNAFLSPAAAVAGDKLAASVPVPTFPLKSPVDGEKPITNIFARPPITASVGVGAAKGEGAAKASPFPLPPTRNVFHPSSLSRS